MTNTSTAGMTDLDLELIDIEHRFAELFGGQSEPQPQPQTTAPAHSRMEPIYPPPGIQLSEAALYVPAGNVVRTLAPHSEAHPAAILLQLLAAFGNLVGPGPHCMVDATRHGLNLFVVLVGESSKARKGTSLNQIVRLFSEVDRPWLDARITTARLTANGLVYALRDQQPPTDRRLLAVSEEFAAILHTLSRAKGHLSPLLRSAWDSGQLRTLDGRRPLQATGTHISLIAHITQRELAQNLHPTEAHNGFANRCLWTCVQRSQCLPDGGNLSAREQSAVASELRRALDWVGSATDILFARDNTARELWQDWYPVLSQVHPGLYGAATSRAEAQVLRLSAIYAALDCTSVIGVDHLQAALAVWHYCSASAALLFGTATGDHAADRIKEALDAAPDGLSRIQIRALFHGHLSSERIDAALQQLMSIGVIGQQTQPSRGGRCSTLWTARPNGELHAHAASQAGT
jgi:hypothetical protein